MTRHWTPEERKRQADLIRQWQPWNKSSGAKTAQGKAVSSKNAYKGGMRATMRELSRLLKEQYSQIVIHRKRRQMERS